MRGSLTHYRLFITHILVYTVCDGRPFCPVLCALLSTCKIPTHGQRVQPAFSEVHLLCWSRRVFQLNLLFLSTAMGAAFMSLYTLSERYKGPRPVANFPSTRRTHTISRLRRYYTRHLLQLLQISSYYELTRERSFIPGGHIFPPPGDTPVTITRP